MKPPKLLQQFRRSFSTAYPNPLWLAASLLLPAMLSPILLFSGFQGAIEHRDPLYYLLSAQAETLGTLFVLGFTITLVAAQIASRYSHILLNRMMGSWALWYAVPFGVGILLPLFLLRGSFYLWSSQISLLLASYCLVLLLPFAVAVRRLLSISEAMSDLKSELSMSDTETEARNLVSRLANISIGALNLKDYETFELGIREIMDGARPVSGLSSCRFLVVKEIRRLIVRTVDDQFASEVLFNAIFDLGVRQPIDSCTDAEGEILDEVAEAYRFVNSSCLRHHQGKIMLIGQYADVAIGRGQRSVVSKLQVILHIVGQRAISEFSLETEPVEQVLSTLGSIAQQVMNAGGKLTTRDDLVKTGIIALEDLGTMGIDSNRDDVKNWAMLQLQRIADDPSEVSRRVERSARASIEILMP